MRSVIDPEDVCLLRLGPRSRESRWLEEADAERRRVRLVWTWATLVGVAGRARKAAAAAAALREEVEAVESRRKAVRAAVAADGETVDALRGYQGKEVNSLGVGW